MNKLYSLTAIASILALTSCASIVQGKRQKVDVRTTPTSNANCVITNGRGHWEVKAPGTEIVKRSKTDLEVKCTDPVTGATGTKTVEPDMESWLLGNILLGGLIGLGVDFGTGSAWDYDTNIDVSLNMPAIVNNYSTPPLPGTTIEPVVAPAMQGHTFAPAAQPTTVQPAPAPQPTQLMSPPPGYIAPK